MTRRGPEVELCPRSDRCLKVKRDFLRGPAVEVEGEEGMNGWEEDMVVVVEKMEDERVGGRVDRGHCGVGGEGTVC